MYTKRTKTIIEHVLTLNDAQAKLLAEILYSRAGAGLAQEILGDDRHDFYDATGISTTGDRQLWLKDGLVCRR